MFLIIYFMYFIYSSKGPHNPGLTTWLDYPYQIVLLNCEALTSPYFFFLQHLDYSDDEAERKESTFDSGYGKSFSEDTVVVSDDK